MITKPVYPICSARVYSYAALGFLICKKMHQKRRGDISVSMETDTAHINKLPPEVLCLILSKLPPHSVCVCRTVLKSWNQLIQEPSFAKHHHSVSPLAITVVFRTHSDHECPTSFGFVKLGNNRRGYTLDVTDKVIHMPSLELALVGSCNGLICLTSYDLDTGSGRDGFRIVVCNPMLGTHFVLPDPPSVPGDSEINQQFGFAYIPSLGQYKVVKIAYLSDQRRLMSYVCTIECGRKRKVTPPAWRKSTTVDVDQRVPKLVGCYSNPIFYNGSIIWVAEPAYQEECFCLIYFDVQNEILQTFVLPPEVCKGLGEMIDFYGVNFVGQIGVYHDHEGNNHVYLCEEMRSCANIWVMETCNCKENSCLEPKWGEVKWTIHLPSTDRLPVRLFKVFEDGKLLISLKNSNLAHYYPSTGVLETLDHPQLPGTCDGVELTVDTPSLLGCLL